MGGEPDTEAPGAVSLGGSATGGRKVNSYTEAWHVWMTGVQDSGAAPVR